VSRYDTSNSGHVISLGKVERVERYFFAIRHVAAALMFPSPFHTAETQVTWPRTSGRKFPTLE